MVMLFEGERDEADEGHHSETELINTPGEFLGGAEDVYLDVAPV